MASIIIIKTAKFMSSIVDCHIDGNVKTKNVGRSLPSD